MDTTPPTLDGPDKPLDPLPSFIRLNQADDDVAVAPDPAALPEVESSAFDRIRRAANFAGLLIGVIALVLGASTYFLHVAENREANQGVWNELSTDAGRLVGRASLRLAEGDNSLLTDPTELRDLAATHRAPRLAADGQVVDPGEPIDLRTAALLTEVDGSLALLPAFAPWAQDLPEQDELPSLDELEPGQNDLGVVDSLPVAVVEADGTVSAFVAFDTGAGSAPLYLLVQRNAIPRTPIGLPLIVFFVGLLGAALLLLPTVAKREALLEQQEAAVAGLVRSKADALRSVNALERTKSDFLTAVSHRFRSPLQVVQGTAKLLADPSRELTPEMTATLAQRLDKNAKRLDELLQDLLDVDRLTRGTMTPVRRDLDVVEAIGSVVDQLDLADRVNMPDASATAKVDPSHLERIVEHLLRNAVQYSPEGSPIDVSAERQDDACEFRIEDRGKGIEQEHRLRVFDPLYRVEDGRSDPGVGIGLALVQRLAAAHGGRAWAEAREGGGTTIAVRIPDVDNERGVDLWQLSGNVAT